MDFGNKFLDDDSRVITVHHLSFFVSSPFALCSKRGKSEACGNRAIFREFLQ
jgi:hypothetical protein